MCLITLVVSVTIQHFYLPLRFTISGLNVNILQVKSTLEAEQ